MRQCQYRERQKSRQGLASLGHTRSSGIQFSACWPAAQRGSISSPGILRRIAELHKLYADIIPVWAKTGPAATQEWPFRIPNELITINPSRREKTCSSLPWPGSPAPIHQLTLQSHLPFLPSSPIKEFITFCSAFLPKCESETNSTVLKGTFSQSNYAPKHLYTE